MSKDLSIGEKTLSDSALLPWAVGSLARSLLFFAQGQQQSDRRALMAVSVYYSLFHLGMFLIFTCPKHQTGSMSSRIQKGLQKLGKSVGRSWTNDPSVGVSHGMVETFLQICTNHGLSISLVDALISARNMREFINYGPRVNWDGSGTIFVDTCQHRSSEVLPIQDQLPSIFRDAILWACKEGSDDGIWVPENIRLTKGFFSGTTTFYAEWCTNEECQIAESLRMSLEELARKTVYNNRTG